MKACAALVLVAFAPLAGQATPSKVTGGGAPAVSPDGRRIAYFSDRSGVSQLYAIGADGTNEFQVTHGSDRAGSPATWAPDQRQLTFTTFMRDTTRVFTIGTDGGGLRQIAVAPGRMAVPSPDRRRVVYSIGDWKANKLMTADLDGGNARQIFDSSSIAWNMKWSPDGKQIAFTGRDEGGGDLAVFVMNADGSGRHQVTHIVREKGNAQVPAWSTDGHQLAMQVSGVIWTVDLATGMARELTPHPSGYVDETPSWFPDGKQIAFQSDRTGRMEVWVMNADGTGQRQVTGNPR